MITHNDINIEEVETSEEWLQAAISYYYKLIDRSSNGMTKQTEDEIWSVNYDWLLVFEALILKRLKAAFPVFRKGRGDMHLARHIRGPQEMQMPYTPLKNETLVRVYWLEGPSEEKVIGEIKSYLTELGVRDECLAGIEFDAAGP